MSLHDESFQARVKAWLLECFGETIAADKTERCHRFLEESLELVQSIGITASEAHQLVDYVFSRPTGDRQQECGGVMVTLAALCQAVDLDMTQAGETELTRVWTKIEKIRAKQAGKPKSAAAVLAKQREGELKRRIENWRAWVAQIIGFDHITTSKTDQDMREDVDRDRAACLVRLDELQAEVERLKQRLLTAAGDDLCRLTQEEIKAMSAGTVKIPPKEEFLASCERFHAQVANESGVMTNCLTLAQLVAENTALRQANDKLRGVLETIPTIVADAIGNAADD
jgi:hypothetical protein